MMAANKSLEMGQEKASLLLAKSEAAKKFRWRHSSSIDYETDWPAAIKIQ